MKLNFDIFEAFKILSNPMGEGIPYICRQVLGTEKGNALAPLLISLIESVKNKTPQDVTALITAVSAVEAPTA